MQKRKEKKKAPYLFVWRISVKYSYVQNEISGKEVARIPYLVECFGEILVEF